jgi:hypothetical protein
MLGLIIDDPVANHRTELSVKQNKFQTYTVLNNSTSHGKMFTLTLFLTASKQ